MLFNPLDYTTVFLSYDEPNCESNYRHLLTLNPNALRVHGVKGSDTAHKEVSKLSKTDNVIVIDGDNFVKPSFYNTTLDLPNITDITTSVLSFSGCNSINGTQYGNGGIKVWPVKLLQDMKTHENSDNNTHTVDFDCANYIELNTVASYVNVHCTPLQAFRAGFREGVKLCLENDKPIQFSNMDKYNFDRLWMWCHVGADLDFGLYGIYGARLGCYKTLIEKFDFTQIQDFDYLNNLFRTIDLNEIDSLGRKLNNPFFVDVLSPEDSIHIKKYYVNPKRSDNPKYETSDFIEWCDSYRECAKTLDQNKINMLCTTGRDRPYGNTRMNAARAAKNFKDNPINLYDYHWLKEQYDKLH